MLHRHNLERILPRFNVAGLSEDTMRHLNLAWHRLDAWPDSAPGLARLKRKFLIAPVSNGNISLMVDLARHDFPWDAILGSEIAGDFKPKPRVYLAACEAFDLPPGDCMMVAAHSSDLAAAAKNGLRTGHIARPNEHGPGKGETAPTVRSMSQARAWRIWLASSGCLARHHERVSAAAAVVPARDWRRAEPCYSHHGGHGAAKKKPLGGLARPGGRLSLLRISCCCSFRAGRDRRLRRRTVGFGPRPDQRRDPPHRLLGADVPADALAMTPLRRIARFGQSSTCAG